MTATLEQTSSAAETVLQTMRTRRVVRSFTDEPVSEAHLRMILESARWALSAGNRYISKFLWSRTPTAFVLSKRSLRVCWRSPRR